jgi:hypothetical protein
VALLFSVALLLVVGCSSSGTGNTSISLGLSGSTADNPSAPPSVAGNGPSGVYAFVYDDQIWIHKSNYLTPLQVTHLALSRGADIIWGPLVWSPDGTHIAFALVHNLTPKTVDSIAGPIYVVDTSNGNTVVTPGIGSVYGHNYAWYGPNMLFYSSGDGISMYDLGDPDPRVWPVLTSFTTPDDETFSSNAVFGDIAITNDDTLYYSAAQVTSLGSTGTVGSASIYQAPLPPLVDYNAEFDQYASTSPVTVAAWLYQRFPLPRVGWNSYRVADLGEAYADSDGNFTMGSWQISSSGSRFVWQVVHDVDTQTVSSSFCSSSTGGECSTSVLGNAGTYSKSIHGQLSLSPDASSIAFTSDALYLQELQAASGEGAGALPGITRAGWILPAAMSPQGGLAVATQVVSSSRSSEGVLRVDTNLVAFDGAHHYVLIAGAEDVAWQP